jgi:hypothetical protein
MPCPYNFNDNYVNNNSMENIMRKNKICFLLLAVLLISCAKSSLKDKIPGKWKIETISGKRLSELPENSRKLAPTSVEFFKSSEGSDSVKMNMGALSLTASYTVAAEDGATLSLDVRIEGEKEQVLTVIFTGDDNIMLRDKELDMTAVRDKGN